MDRNGHEAQKSGAGHAAATTPPPGPAPGARGATRADGRGLGQLFLELTRETSALVRAEVALARTEIEEKVGEAQKGMASMATGGGVLLAGALTLIACIVLALSRVWPAWAAALVVGAIVTAIGVALVLSGRNRLKAQKERGLPRTSASLRQDKQLAREHL